MHPQTFAPESGQGKDGSEPRVLTILTVYTQSHEPADGLWVLTMSPTDSGDKLETEGIDIIEK